MARFVAAEPDVAIAISAPAAAALVAAHDRLKLVITALGPEAAAEIVDGAPSIAGLVLPPPYTAQLQLARALAPDATKLYVPHTKNGGAAPLPAELGRAAVEIGFSWSRYPSTAETTSPVPWPNG